MLISRGGAFLLAGGQTCRRSGPERPGSAARDSTQSGAVTRTEQPPADRQKHQQARKAQGTPPPADRQKPPPVQRARATGQAGTAPSQRHHQDDRPATRHDRSQTHDKQQHTTRQAPPKPQNEKRAGDPPEGGTPATFAHRWPGHWQARPPPVGGLPPCAGLALALPAGATAGTPARRRRSPRPAARECAGRRRLRRQCARRSKLRPPAGARAAAAARSRGPGSAGGRHPQRGAPGRYAGRRVRRQSRAARPAP